MAKAWLSQSTFNAGVLDPRLKSRYDLGVYYNGMRKADNVLSIPHGGIKRRYGTLYRATLPGMARLLTFQFNVSQVYVVAISAGRIDIYGSDGVLKDSITSGVPYLEADLFEIDFAQSGDTMILAHEDHATQRLVRVGDTNWTLSAVSFVYIPQYDFDDASSPSPTSEIQTVEFDNDVNAGDTYKLELEGLETDTITYSSSTSENESRIASALQDLANTGDTGVSVAYQSGRIYQITLAGASANDWELMSGRFITTAGADATVFLFTRTQAGTSRAENVWSSTRGWPRSVTFHEGRLVFGGSFSRPSTIWMSRTFRFFDFNVAKARADDAIDYTLDTGEVNVIQAVVSGRALQVFTSGGEFYIPQSPVTPEEISIVQQTRFGSRQIKPIVIDGATIFVQRLGSAIREFLYVDAEQAYSSESINIRAPELTSDVVQMASAAGTSNEDANYVFAVNRDGTMGVFNTLRSEQVSAWTRWETRAGDAIKSVCVLDNILWLAVERIINGSTVYYLEEASPDARLDCSVMPSQALSTTVSGLSHLEGETVRVRQGDLVLGSEAVSGGQITADEAVTTPEIGLNWVPDVELMPLMIVFQGQTIAPTRKRLVSTSVDLIDSAGVLVQGRRLVSREHGASLLDQSMPTITGRVKTFHGGWYSDDLVVSITQDDPLPFQVLGIEVEAMV